MPLYEHSKSTLRRPNHRPPFPNLLMFYSFSRSPYTLCPMVASSRKFLKPRGYTFFEIDPKIGGFATFAHLIMIKPQNIEIIYPYPYFILFQAFRLSAFHRPPSFHVPHPSRTLGRLIPLSLAHIPGYKTFRAALRTTWLRPRTPGRESLEA